MKISKGWERRAVRSLAKEMYGGPNSMKMVYKDQGCIVFWVDGWGHEGFFVAVTDPSKCLLKLFPTKYGGVHEWKYPWGDVALTVYVYEEDVEWAYLVNDNPQFAAIGIWAEKDPNVIMRNAADTEKSYPRGISGIVYPTREETIDLK